MGVEERDGEEGMRATVSKRDVESLDGVVEETGAGFGMEVGGDGLGRDFVRRRTAWVVDSVCASRLQVNCFALSSRHRGLSALEACSLPLRRVFGKRFLLRP